VVRAQDGDQDAYRRLLEDIAGYLRPFVVQRQIDSSDVEDTVQDILFTIHAVRHTFDPNRPFEPWLAAIAHRRIADKHRHLARQQQHAHRRQLFSRPQPIALSTENVAMQRPSTLRELASWYREFAERTGNPTIWESRLCTAEDLDAEADRIEQHLVVTRSAAD
jgi:DNA-directed RNA polymerase specialized sigma24 family protein